MGWMHIANSQVLGSHGYISPGTYMSTTDYLIHAGCETVCPPIRPVQPCACMTQAGLLICRASPVAYLLMPCKPGRAGMSWMPVQLLATRPLMLQVTFLALLHFLLCAKPSATTSKVHGHGV